MLYGCTFQNILLALFHATSRSYYPGEAGTSPVWAIPRSLATTGGITNLFSLPAGTKMFQFPAFASASADDWPSASRVVPFGNPRIKGHLHLPAAYRSLSRPSSPVRAKASAIRPFLLSFARTCLLSILPANGGRTAEDRRFIYFQLYL